MPVLSPRPGLFRTRSLRRRAIIAALLWLAALAAAVVGGLVAVFGAPDPFLALGIPGAAVVAFLLLVQLAWPLSVSAVHGWRLGRRMPLGRYFATAPGTRLPGRHRDDYETPDHQPTRLQPAIRRGIGGVLLDIEPPSGGAA